MSSENAKINIGCLRKYWYLCYWLTIAKEAGDEWWVMGDEGRGLKSSWFLLMGVVASIIGGFFDYLRMERMKTNNTNGGKGIFDMVANSQQPIANSQKPTAKR